MAQLAVESTTDRADALPTMWLTGADLVELDRATYLVRRAWLPMASVRREDFPLRGLGDRLAELADDLDAEGVCLLRGLRTAGYSEADLRLLYWGLGRHLGVAVPQDAAGRLVGRAAPTSGFHNGGSDVVALLSVSGGHSVGVVSSRTLYGEVAARRPDLAERMFATFAFDRHDEQGTGEPAYRLLPLACRSNGRQSLRYDRPAIERAQRHGDTPRLTGADRELLDLVDELLPGLREEVRLESGDILLVNSHEVLHRVEAADDATDRPGLVRLWLTLRNGRELPDGYIWPTPTYAGEPGRGGVTPLDV
jgi:hypothetical protein